MSISGFLRKTEILRLFAFTQFQMQNRSALLLELLPKIRRQELGALLPSCSLLPSATQGRNPSRRVFAKAPLRGGAGGRDGASLEDRFVEIELIATPRLIQITKI